MPRSKEIPEDLRRKAVEAYESGKGYKAISKALGLPRTTVRAILCKWRKFGIVVNLPRSGRPAEISPVSTRPSRKIVEDITHIHRTSPRDPKASLASAKKLLKATQKKSQQRIQEREKELQDLRQAVQSLTRSAQAAVEDSDRILAELIRSIERRCSEVKELIRDQEKAAVSEAEGLLERMEQEIAELRRRDAELEQISNTQDYIHFLQNWKSLCAPPVPGDLPSITVNPHLSFEAVRKSVSELKERLEDICNGELVKISQAAAGLVLDSDSAILWEKKLKMEEEGRAAHPGLSPVSSMASSDAEDQPDWLDNLETEYSDVQERKEIREGAQTSSADVTISSEEEEDVSVTPPTCQLLPATDSIPTPTARNDTLSGRSTRRKARTDSVAYVNKRSTRRSSISQRTTTITRPVAEVHILEPRTREDLLHYSCRLTLDPNTAHRELSLSDSNREVTCVRETQPYPDHPERFDCYDQVLCREGLSGRCYWEAEWSGGGVSLAAAYKDINRKGLGAYCGLGCNDKSWSLSCFPSMCYFLHNDKTSKILSTPSHRIGVYLDHRAGTLSFYSVSDTITLLHRVQTTFTQPLYPGFGANTVGASIKLCDLR
ncbi:hypothetical protein AGOR_G00172040 [Albula goreensis]|uniref:B30.2/SPRY domain-containing protein n=1 Tax=Albula goreensis TaxID=1534307 RepID=A0A8T3CYD9_9TELE|nr:hypothetical protein AGOR_G00172040 [Albula goreensis]